MTRPVAVLMPDDAAAAVAAARKGLEALLVGEWTCTRRWTTERVEVIASLGDEKVRTWEMPDEQGIPRAMSWWTRGGRSVGYLSCSHAGSPILHDPDLRATSADILETLRTYVRSVLEILGAREPGEPMPKDHVRAIDDFTRLASACMVANGDERPSRRCKVRAASPWSSPAIVAAFGVDVFDTPDWIDDLLRKGSEDILVFATVVSQGAPDIFDLMIRPSTFHLDDVDMVEAMRIIGRTGRTNGDGGKR